MTMELKIGYSDEIAEMIYRAFTEHTFLKNSKYKLLDLDTSKERLKLMDFVAGVYDGKEPIAAWWGKNEEISVISLPSVKGKWITKGLLRKFFDFFFSKYETARAKANDDASYAMLLKAGFKGTHESMEKQKW